MSKATLAVQRRIHRKGVWLGKIAYWMCFISVLLLWINGLMAILLRKQIAEMLEMLEVEGITASTMLTFGIIWLILGALVWVTTLHIEKRNMSSEKWFLLLLGIITIFSGRFVSGVLTAAAAVLYLFRR